VRVADTHDAHLGDFWWIDSLQGFSICLHRIFRPMLGRPGVNSRPAELVADGKCSGIETWIRRARRQRA
jgi:hypothetical protein